MSNQSKPHPPHPSLILVFVRSAFCLHGNLCWTSVWTLGSSCTFRDFRTMPGYFRVHWNARWGSDWRTPKQGHNSHSSELSAAWIRMQQLCVWFPNDRLMKWFRRWWIHHYLLAKVQYLPWVISRCGAACKTDLCISMSCVPTMVPTHRPLSIGAELSGLLLEGTQSKSWSRCPRRAVSWITNFTAQCVNQTVGYQVT